MSAAPTTTAAAHRLRDWAERLDALVRARRAAPFAWGTHDCCTWAADCMLAVTGHDPAARWRGSYGTALGAARLLAELGGVAALAARHAGAEVRPALAQPGDLGLVDGPADAGSALAVCLGHAWCLPGAAGLLLLPPAAAHRAWRVTAGS